MSSPVSVASTVYAANGSNSGHVPFFGAPVEAAERDFQRAVEILDARLDAPREAGVVEPDPTIVVIQALLDIVENHLALLWIELDRLLDEELIHLRIRVVVPLRSARILLRSDFLRQVSRGDIWIGQVDGLRPTAHLVATPCPHPTGGVTAEQLIGWLVLDGY